MRVRRLSHVSLNVADLARAQAFYQDALGFVPVGPARDVDPAIARLLGVTQARAVRLRLGAQEIELVATDSVGRPMPSDSSSADHWFQHCALVTDDIARSYVRLQAHPFAAISLNGPERLPDAAGGVTAFKFRDPDGHPLELIEFPHGTVASGIDHSAISVADAARSVAFYTALGLSVGARQINAGPEQDRLDGLPQVRVEVVALLPETSTPHVELLGYMQPPGRPADLWPSDIAATRLVLAAEAGPRLEQDPDGHWLLFDAAG